jgi:NADPH-dependent 2,4-dienoyl-CoA reductase/sulfur reductase-like enzyme
MADPRIVIVGAGPAGTRAAERIGAAGLRPIVVDEAVRSGGQIYRRQPAGFTRAPAALYGFDAGKALAVHAAFDALGARIDYRPETLAWNVYDRHVHLLRGNEARAEAFDALILAPGASDRVVPVAGWTLPGVFTLGGAQIALKAQACAIGSATVFMGTGPLLYLVAYQYAKAGARVVAVLDTSPFAARLQALGGLAARPGLLAKGLWYTAALRARGIRMMSAIVPVAIEGAARVRHLRVRDAAGREHGFDCDAVALGYGLRAETQLADLARCRFAFDPVARQWLPESDADGRSTTPGIYLAGDGARILGADAAENAGRLAACAVLADLGHALPAEETAGLRATQARMKRFGDGLARAFPWPAAQAAALGDEVTVCRCESITAGELRRSARDQGALELNRAKALSRIGMGRCQGRFCGLAAAEILAAELKVDVAQVGRLRGQAPVKPLPVATEFRA